MNRAARLGLGALALLPLLAAGCGNPLDGITRVPYGNDPVYVLVVDDGRP